MVPFVRSLFRGSPIRALRTRIAASLVCAAGLIGAPRAKAQDPHDAVTLALRFAKGDHWSIDEDLSMHLALTVSTGSAAESAAQSSHRVRRGDLTVLEAEPGRLDAVRVRFGGECLDTEQVGDGELVKRPTALAGLSLTVKRKAGAEPSLEGAMALSDDEKQEARVLLDPSPGMLPTHAVKVGDRWAADAHALPPALAKVLAIGPGDACAFRLLLKELGNADGRRVAGLGAELVVDQKREGSTTKYEFAGAIVLDVEKGIALAIDLHGTVWVSGHTEHTGGNGKAVKSPSRARATSGTAAGSGFSRPRGHPPPYPRRSQAPRRSGTCASRRPRAGSRRPTPTGCCCSRPTCLRAATSTSR